MTDESLLKRVSYQRHKAEHRCVSCGKVDDRTRSGFVQCDACAARNRERHRQHVIQNPDDYAAGLQFLRERYYRLKALHRCVVCGQSDDRTQNGQTCCTACATKRRQRRAIRKAKQKEVTT